MNCAACNYMMSDFDTECPRCHGKGVSQSQAPSPQPGPGAPQLAVAPAMSTSSAFCPHCNSRNTLPVGPGPYVCGICKKTFVLTKSAANAHSDPFGNKLFLKWCIGIAAFIFIVIPLGIAILVKTAGPIELDDNDRAYYESVRAIEQKLKAPSTAKFCGQSKAEFSKLSSGAMVVQGYVDSQNSFGAMIRADWIVKLRPSPTSKGYWVVENASVIGSR